MMSFLFLCKTRPFSTRMLSMNKCIKSRTMHVSKKYNGYTLLQNTLYTIFNIFRYNVTNLITIVLGYIQRLIHVGSFQKLGTDGQMPIQFTNDNLCTESVQLHLRFHLSFQLVRVPATLTLNHVSHIAIGDKVVADCILGDHHRFGGLGQFHLSRHLVAALEVLVHIVLVLLQYNLGIVLNVVIVPIVQSLAHNDRHRTIGKVHHCIVVGAIHHPNRCVIHVQKVSRSIQRREHRLQRQLWILQFALHGPLNLLHHERVRILCSQSVRRHSDARIVTDNRKNHIVAIKTKASTKTSAHDQRECLIKPE
ncbi:Orf57 [Heliothis zea nudivirus]|uniref:Orf57 n=1 Tax=Heliothis zea nudivirus 1 TaxID=3116536 RepID=Q8JKQ4_9VIRU|nr:Orf57 [Heliothis zea nudivirus]AAN04351.1 Orf57 [Heliothis zea nudivirus]